jgi:hypothetical protein
MKNLIIPYSIAIGILNLVLTTILTLVVSYWIFHFPLTWKMFGENYLVGYVVLWILNIETIKGE